METQNKLVHWMLYVLGVVASLAVLLGAFVAVAQTRPNIERGNALRRSEYVTQSALNFFVETTGNDANDCASISTPCLTLQAALNRIPKRIRHAVTVSMGAGNFAGANLESFTIDAPVDGATGSYLMLQGTLNNFVPATGTATGTVSSATAGNLNQTFGTLTHTGQTWTVNNLRGQLVSITSGPGAGQVRSIASNTATAITIAGPWATTPTAASTYAILDWATSLTTTVPRTVTPLAGTGPNANLVISNIQNNTSLQNNGASLIVKDLQVAGTGTVRAIFIGVGSRGYFKNVRATQPSGTGTGIVVRSSYARLEDCIVTRATNTGGSNVTADGDGEFQMINSVLLGSYNGLRIHHVTSAFNTVNNNFITGFGNAGMDLTGLSQGQMTGNRIDCASAAATIGINTNTLDFASTYGGDGWTGYAQDVSNCAGAAVQVLGPTAVRMQSSWSGTGNAITVSALKGAKVMIDAAVAMTSTTSDISLNGATTYTLAEMRAGTPRKLVSDVGDATAVFEN